MVAMVMVHQWPNVPCIGAPAGPGSLQCGGFVYHSLATWRGNRGKRFQLYGPWRASYADIVGSSRDGCNMLRVVST